MKFILSSFGSGLTRWLALAYRVLQKWQSDQLNPRPQEALHGAEIFIPLSNYTSHQPASLRPISELCQDLQICLSDLKSISNKCLLWKLGGCFLCSIIMEIDNWYLPAERRVTPFLVLGINWEYVSQSGNRISVPFVEREMSFKVVISLPLKILILSAEAIGSFFGPALPQT